jgi:adenylate kinase
VLELFRRKEYVVTVDARDAKDDVQREIRTRLGLPAHEPTTAAEEAPEAAEAAGGR